MEDAQKALVRYAKKVTVKDPPRFYKSIVSALISLGKKDVALQFVQRIAQNEEKEKRKHRPIYDFDRSAEMAQLHHAVGEVDAVRTIYVERIEIRLREGHLSTSIANDITRAITLTGDKATFMEKMIRLHEVHGEYERASKIAADLGNLELAETYQNMHQMIQSTRGK